ncbi:type 4a pilus biogenesis protein PilO [Permianibacter sp. IMCC34836]|uniref:type 4a pilus biogenesis protein PilO n=1 Tax=Permianibacter fluminis TaxID=2738515 RepID=UPI00155579AC|nr:type 4a pilus biogenesis protein PilO [Permianibacter fluminis]NQD36293.1 type 4a pilus biogenesis protein PilO [Permianibacter fluminis]
MKLDFRDLQKIDFNNLGNAPTLAKGFLITIACLVVVGLALYLFTSDQWDQLDAARKQEATKRSEFEEKQRKAANLGAYRQQMQQMQEAFKDLLRQLPKSTEVPGLVDEISYAASGSGLSSEKLEKNADVKREFYIETPIEISVKGGYHQIGEFISKVSALPRIVTIHDFTLKTSAKPGDIESSDSLTLSVVAKTYRYEAEEGK